MFYYVLFKKYVFFVYSQEVKTIFSFLNNNDNRYDNI